MSKKTNEVENAPNIQWVGKLEKYNIETEKRELIPMDAPTAFYAYGLKIVLPKGIENGVFMDVEVANVLKETFPNFFKTPVQKGK